MDSAIATIKIALIKATIKVKDGHEFEFIENFPDSRIAGQEWKNVLLEAPILVYPIELLKEDGFIAISFLEKLSSCGGGAFSIFGGFKNFGGLRCHLIFPLEKALKSNLIVLDWEIIKWTQKTLTQKN